MPCQESQSPAEWNMQITYEVPDKDILMKNTNRLETMVENLLQGCDQAVFSAQENCEASPLQKERENKIHMHSVA